MSQFKYSVGPWNVAEGADVYGPELYVLTHLLKG